MRKTETVTIDLTGRDNGRSYVLTEMDAWRTIKWAGRAVSALLQSGGTLPTAELMKAAEKGPETLSALGLRIFAYVPESVSLALMEELRACVTFKPANSAMSTQPIMAGDQCQIEEPSTWAVLLQRLFVMHLGFLAAASPPITG